MYRSLNDPFPYFSSIALLCSSMTSILPFACNLLQALHWRLIFLSSNALAFTLLSRQCQPFPILPLIGSLRWSKQRQVIQCHQPSLSVSLYLTYSWMIESSFLFSWLTSGLLCWGFLPFAILRVSSIFFFRLISSLRTALLSFFHRLAFTFWISRLQKAWYLGERFLRETFRLYSSSLTVISMVFLIHLAMPNKHTINASVGCRRLDNTQRNLKCN